MSTGTGTAIALLVTLPVLIWIAQPIADRLDAKALLASDMNWIVPTILDTAMWMGAACGQAVLIFRTKPVSDPTDEDFSSTGGQAGQEPVT